jgi:hypothetical protein
MLNSYRAAILESHDYYRANVRRLEAVGNHDAWRPLPAIQIQPCDPLLYIGVPAPAPTYSYSGWGYTFALPGEIPHDGYMPPFGG